jgi:hypothetical protein
MPGSLSTGIPGTGTHRYIQQQRPERQTGFLHS